MVQAVPWVIFVLVVAWLLRPPAIDRHRAYVKHLEELERGTSPER